MPEAIKVTPQEAHIILLSDIEKFGHYDEQVARILHPGSWRKQYNPRLRTHWETLLASPDKEQRFNRLIQGALAYVGESGDPRSIHLLRLRFGMKDGFLRTYREVSDLMYRLRIRPVETIRVIDEASEKGISISQVCSLKRITFFRLHRFFYKKIDEFLPPEEIDQNPVVPFLKGFSGRSNLTLLTPPDNS